MTDNLQSREDEIGAHHFITLGIFIVVAAFMAWMARDVYRMRQEDASAQQTLLAMAAKEVQPPVRSATLGKDGVTYHTLCSGSGWCVTSATPPTLDDLPHSSPVRDGGGMATVNERGLNQMIEAARETCRKIMASNAKAPADATSERGKSLCAEMNLD